MFVGVCLCRFCVVYVIVADRRLTAFEVEVDCYRVDEVQGISLVELHADLVLRLHCD